MASRRPDGRLFVKADELTDAIAGADEPVYFNCDLDNDQLVAQCHKLGMQTEFVSTSYDVPFAGLLARLPERLTSPTHTIVPADQVDATTLCELDAALRQDVPGTSGWVGNQDWFDAELASAEFDPSGYLIAKHQATGALVGLIRFWHRPSSATLGLLAVLPQHRNGYLSSVLLRRGLLGAASWGFDTFKANTARPALQRRLVRAGATPTGRFAQMASEPAPVSLGSLRRVRLP